MEEFIESIEDPKDYNCMAIAIQGRGAFRRFKDMAISSFENFLKPKKFAYCTPAYTPIKTGNDYMRRQFKKFDMQHIVGK